MENYMKTHLAATE